MRLRLAIQRHALPKVDVLWNISLNHSSPSASTTPMTIAQLLDQVNEIFPLEGDGWGLEDYVVRVGKYECLHFNKVVEVLKDEDAVSIQHIQTPQSKALRAGGRRQILEDGMHLIDGVPFGKASSGRLQRPEVYIPPLKKRRTAAVRDGEEDSIADSYANPLLLENVQPLNDFQEWETSSSATGTPDLISSRTRSSSRRSSTSSKRVHFSDSEEPRYRALLRYGDLGDVYEDDVDDDEDDESDEDFAEEELECEDGNNEEDIVSEDDLSDQQREAVKQSLDKQEKKREKKRKKEQKKEAKKEKKMEKKRQKEKRKASEMEQDRENDTNKRKEKSKTDKKKASKRTDTAAKSLDLAEQETAPRDTASRTPQKVSPPDEGSNSTHVRNNRRKAAKRLRKLQAKGLLPESASFEELREYEQSGPQDQERTRVENHDPESRDLQVLGLVETETIEGMSRKAKKKKKSEKDKDDGKQTAEPTLEEQKQSSNNVGLSEENAGNSDVLLSLNTTSKSDRKKARKAREAEELARKADSTLESMDQEQSETSRLGTSPSPEITIKQKKKKNKKVNEEIPPGESESVNNYLGITQSTDSEEGLPTKKLTKKEKRKKREEAARAAAAANFDSDRQAILDAINSGQPLDATSEDPKTLRLPTTCQSGSGNQDLAQQSLESADGIQSAMGGQTEVSPQTPPKRLRLDLAGSRRLLFGSLGVRAPKTAAEEDELREKLRAQAKLPGRPPGLSASEIERLNNNLAVNGEAGSAEATGGSSVSSTESDDEEFWKSRLQLSAVECVDEGVRLSTPPFPFVQRWDPQQQHYDNRNKKRKRASSQNFHENYGPDVMQSYEDVDQTPNDQVDLPEPPADTSQLAALDVDLAKPEAIICFRRLECSASTNWSPVVSSLQTAKIAEVTKTDNATALTLELAYRHKPKKVKRFDNKGRRLYDKFENVDESDDENDRYLELDYSDLVEPKLLHTSPEGAIEPYTEGFATTFDDIETGNPITATAAKISKGIAGMASQIISASA